MTCYGNSFYQIDLKFTCSHQHWLLFVDEYNRGVQRSKQRREYYPNEIVFNREAFLRTNPNTPKHLFFIDYCWRWDRLLEFINENCISSWEWISLDVGYYRGLIYPEPPFLYRDNFSINGWATEPWTRQAYPRGVYNP
jgi:hypothetical protein